MAQTTEGGGATITSNSVPEESQPSLELLPSYFSPPPTVGPDFLREQVTQDSPDPPGSAEAPFSVLPQEVYREASLDAAEDTQQVFKNLDIADRDHVDVTPVMTDSTPLSLQCRMCDAPPTVGTRPTVTTCGHLFCSRCVLRSLDEAVVFTSRQMHHTTRNVDFKMSRVRQCPPVVLLV